LEEIHELEPSLVLSESTGAARPWPLIKALTQDERFYLRHFIVTVDALNLHRDFQDGAALTKEAKGAQDLALNRAANVLAEQIAFASVIILTKVDTVPETVAQTQVQNLQRLHPGVTIGLSTVERSVSEELGDRALPNKGISLVSLATRTCFALATVRESYLVGTERAMACGSSEKHGRCFTAGRGSRVRKTLTG